MNWPCVNCVSDKLVEWPAHVFTWQVIDLAMCFIFVSDKLGDLLNLMCLLEKLLTCPCACLCFWQVGWPAYMFTWQVIDLAMRFICVSDKLSDLLMCLLEKLLTCPCVYLCFDKLGDPLMCLLDNLNDLAICYLCFWKVGWPDHVFIWQVIYLTMCFICVS